MLNYCEDCKKDFTPNEPKFFSPNRFTLCQHCYIEELQYRIKMCQFNIDKEIKEILKYEQLLNNTKEGK